VGRKPRVEYEGAVYHVIQRGNNREYIFKNDEDKSYLLKRIEDCKQKMGFNLLGYVVMGNHYHLILRTGSRPLSMIMHAINGSYSRHYNWKYDRSGHVFQGRYKAIPIFDDRYLLAVLRYVHRNPERAGICQQASDYPYSSDIHYRKNQGWFVDIDIILGILSQEKRDALRKYELLMDEEDDTDYDNDGPALVEDFLPFPQPEPQTGNRARKSLDEILADTGVSPADFRLIKEGSRKRHLTPYKILYAKEAIRQEYSLKEIGSNISLSDAAIFKLVNEVRKDSGKACRPPAEQGHSVREVIATARRVTQHSTGRGAG